LGSEGVICGIVLAAAFLGQQATFLGEPGGPYITQRGTRRNIPAAVSVDAMSRWLTGMETRDPLKPSLPVDVALLPYGVQVKVVKPCDFVDSSAGSGETVDGRLVRILEGPLTGAHVFVRASQVHEGLSHELITPDPFQVRVENPVGIRIGGISPNGLQVGAMVYGSVDEAKGVRYARMKYVGKDFKLFDATPAMAGLGHGTRAKMVGFVRYEDEVDGESTVRTVVVAKVSEGPAAGRIVYLADGTILPDDAKR
jgi:hypothetical protein